MKEKAYSLGFLVVIALVSIFSFIRFNYLPQFVDGYWHLSMAEGYLKSGGWIPFTWWDFAPSGRVSLYPPLYHILLAHLKMLGLPGIFCLRIFETSIIPVFFLILWWVFKNLVNRKFSFFLIFSLSSFFTFFSSLSANVPATLGLCWGVLSWFFFLNRERASLLKSAFFLGLIFYTHTAVGVGFLFSYLFVLLEKKYRHPVLKIILSGIIFALPFLLHQFLNRHYLSLKLMYEWRFIQFSLPLILGGAASVLFFIYKKNTSSCRSLFLLSCGFLSGLFISFFYYPYRFFSAQGSFAFALLFSLFVITQKCFSKKIIEISLLTLLFIHPLIYLKEGILRFSFFSSTYFHYLTGKMYDLLEFRPLYYPKFYEPIKEVILKYTKSNDIVTSNSPIIAEIFSALTQRPCGNSLLGEVSTLHKPHYQEAKIVIWIKPLGEKERSKFKNYRTIYENDIAYIFLNSNYKNSLKPLKAKFTFLKIDLIFLFLIILVFLKRRNRFFL